MFDSDLIDERKPRLWVWFAGGVAVYLFIVVNVLLSLVAGHISNGAATLLAPGLMLLMSGHTDPFLGFVGGILLTLGTATLFGGLSLELRRALKHLGLFQ